MSAAVCSLDQLVVVQSQGTEVRRDDRAVEVCFPDLPASDAK
jgi:hypothetical protein